LGDAFWKASGNIEESMLINFKSQVKPTKIVVKQPKILENMSRKIKVFLNEQTFETLDLIQDAEPQVFKLEKPSVLETIKISIQNT